MRLKTIKNTRFTGFAVLAILSVFFISSCQTDKNEELPDFSLYSEEEFADILFDLTMVESAYRLNMTTADANLKRDKIHQSILAIHKTDTLTFDQNWNYFSAEPDKMINVYEMVIQKIDDERQKRGAVIQKEIKEE